MAVWLAGGLPADELEPIGIQTIGITPAEQVAIATAAGGISRPRANKWPPFGPRPLSGHPQAAEQVAVRRP